MKTIRRFELRVERVRLENLTAPYGSVIDNSRRAFVAVRSLIGDLEQEVMIVLHLNARGRLVGYHEAGRGSMTQVALDLRSIFRTALVAGAASIILAHNHPSGEASPSEQDDVFTSRALEVAKIVGVPIVDHVIVATEGFWSYADADRLR